MSSNNTGIGGAAFGIVNVDGNESTLTSLSTLSVGANTSGTLNVTHGAKVISGNGSLGMANGFAGVATIDGIGSRWDIGSALVVGQSGSGTLRICDGAAVTSNSCSIGSLTNSTGTVSVVGNGSSWTNNTYLYVGDLGTGTLNIRNGGTIATATAWTQIQSLLAIDVGTGSKLTVGNGSGALTNNGNIRVLAAAGAPANASYAPISATWAGSGSIQALGGVWNSTSHVFTVSGVQSGVSGVPITIDRLSTQRVLIAESTSQQVLGASFASTASSSPLTLTATALSLNFPDQVLFGEWYLSAAGGYTSGNPLYLSFGLGAGGGYSSDDLQLWTYDGGYWSNWTKFTATDLTCDGDYASFTATSLGYYALTAPVPEPCTVVLLAFGLIGFTAAAWRKRRKRVN